MAVDIELLVQVVEVSSQLRSTRIALSEGEIRPDFLFEQLVYRRVRVDPGTWVAVLYLWSASRDNVDRTWISIKYPIPNAATASSFFEDTDIEPLLSKSHHTYQREASLLVIASNYLFSRQIDLDGYD